MSIRAARNINLADISSNPSALILGSIFMTPDTLDAFIGTGTGVKQLAFANGSTSKIFAGATPTGAKVIDGEATFSAASVAVSGAVIPVRGNTTIPSGTTVTAGFLYGTQGKITLIGTLSTANYVAGLVGQLDLSLATALSSTNLTCLWLDAGATSAVAITSLPMMKITNTTTKVAGSIMFVEADATYLMVLNDTGNNQQNYLSLAAIGTYSRRLKCSINGVDYYIPLYLVS